jgi:hypothetical protein
MMSAGDGDGGRSLTTIQVDTWGIGPVSVVGSDAATFGSEQQEQY